ncbi:MAG: TadE/TadG family type IV pilus assembly protein [Thermodesulfobacteriota bacterium]
MGSKDQSQRGASAVEFAIMAPLFIAVLFAIVEFGLILYTQSMLTHASREGARFGVVYCTPRRTTTEIQQVVQNFLNQCGLTSTANVAVTGAGGGSGSNLDVAINYTYQYVVLSKILNSCYLGGVSLPSTLNLASETVMRME